MRKNYKTFFLLFVCIYVLYSLPALAAEYCVRYGASGANNGSNWSDAYSDLPSTLERGSTYYIADGQYSSYTFNDATSGTSVITIKKATSDDHGAEVDVLTGTYSWSITDGGANGAAP